MSACYYCKKPCEPLAGDPSLWPVLLPHADEPGVMKEHHMKCVLERLKENERLAWENRHLHENTDEYMRARDEVTRLRALLKRCAEVLSGGGLCASPACAAECGFAAWSGCAAVKQFLKDESTLLSDLRRENL